MSRLIWIGAVALAAIIAGATYFTRDSADRSPPASQSARDAHARAGSAASTPDTQLDSTSGAASRSHSAHAVSRAVPDDPRLAALMVSPDNDFIEFVAGADGKVIAEIDKDPSSPSFKKPLREYIYSGDKVIGLTAYHYAGDQIQITTTAVAYKADGSVDEYLQSTRYEEESKHTRDRGTTSP